jgi:SAM-dependent methyltransferase
MEYKNIYYPESRFGTFTDVDGTIAFYLRVNGLVDAESVVLDVGCGRGAYADDPTPVRRDLRILKGKVKKVIGIDIDESSEKNPCLDEFNFITEQNLWPLQDSSVDLCLCDNVLEHVEDPEAFFSECQRIVKQGGYLCIRTTNLLSYVGILSKLVPNKLSARVLSRVQDKRREEDIFPTLYRCNTIRRVRSMLEDHGFYHCVYGYEAEPSYLSFSRLSYFLGVMHQRFAPRGIRVAIFAFGRKT